MRNPAAQGATGLGSSLSLLAAGWATNPLMVALAVFIACTTLVAAGLAVRNIIGLFRTGSWRRQAASLQVRTAQHHEPPPTAD